MDDGGVTSGTSSNELSAGVGISVVVDGIDA